MRVEFLERLQSEYGVFAFEPELALPSYSLADIRYSRGFLGVNFQEIFRGFVSQWVPVLSAAEIQVSLQDVTADFSFPGELERLLSFRFGEEVGLFGFSLASERVASQLFLETENRNASQVLMDYLCRRLLFTLVRDLGEQESKFRFIGDVDLGEVDIEGHLHLSLNTSEGECAMHIGLGPELLQQVDLVLKERRLQALGYRKQGRKIPVRVIIAEIPDEAMAGNLEPGVWLATELRSQFPVFVTDGSEQLFVGSLGQFNGRYAVQSLGQVQSGSDLNEGLRLELAAGEMSDEDFFLLREPGGIFLSKSVVSAGAQLTRHGKNITPVTLAELGGRLVFRIEEGGE